MQHGMVEALEGPCEGGGAEGNPSGEFPASGFPFPAAESFPGARHGGHRVEARCLYSG